MSLCSLLSLLVRDFAHTSWPCSLLLPQRIRRPWMILSSFGSDCSHSHLRSCGSCFEMCFRWSRCVASSADLPKISPIACKVLGTHQWWGPKTCWPALSPWLYLFLHPEYWVSSLWPFSVFSVLPKIKWDYLWYRIWHPHPYLGFFW